MHKSEEEESTLADPVREPCLVEMGTGRTAEHGLGAEVSTGRHFRVRPLKRVEAAFAANQGGTASMFVALGFPRVILFFIGGYYMCQNCKGNYYITTPIYYPSANLHIVA